MSLVEKVLIAALGLVALYLWLQSPQSGNIISTIGSTGGGLFGVLQGRDVTFGNPVKISTGAPTGFGGAAY